MDASHPYTKQMASIMRQLVAAMFGLKFRQSSLSAINDSRLVNIPWTPHLKPTASHTYYCSGNYAVVPILRLLVLVIPMYRLLMGV